ncbi:hypothetical protein QEN19_000174 [Hanseniaspora menglaensis]
MFALSRTNSGFDAKSEENNISATRKPFSELSSSQINTRNNKYTENVGKRTKKLGLIEKYSRASNQHSKRSMNSLNIISLSRESSFYLKKPIYENEEKNKEQVGTEEQEDLEGETLREEPKNIDLLNMSFLESQVGGDTDEKYFSKEKNLIDKKRVPIIDRLPSFSFSYSFDPSVSNVNREGTVVEPAENNDTSKREKTSLNKKQINKFVVNLKEAKKNYELKKQKKAFYQNEMISKQRHAVLMQRENKLFKDHSALSISVAESLLNLTTKK